MPSIITTDISSLKAKPASIIAAEIDEYIVRLQEASSRLKGEIEAEAKPSSEKPATAITAKKVKKRGPYKKRAPKMIPVGHTTVVEPFDATQTIMTHLYSLKSHMLVSMAADLGYKGASTKSGKSTIIAAIIRKIEQREV